MVHPNDQLNTFEIVEPGRSDKAAFDPQAYHRAMRAGRSEGVIHYAVTLLGGAIVGFVLATGATPGFRFLVAAVFGFGFAVVLHRIRLAKVKANEAEAIRLHAITHDLQIEANQLEIEKAKASGAFDQWDKS